MTQLSALKGCSTTARDVSNDAGGGGRENHQKKEGEGSWSNNGSENSSDVNNLDHVSRTTPLLNTSSSASSQVIVQGKSLFPSTLRPTSITQLLVQGSSRSHDHHLHNPHHMTVQSSSEQESFCNMFVNGGGSSGGGGGGGVNVAEQDHHPQGFWPWPEQHYFH